MLKTATASIALWVFSASSFAVNLFDLTVNISANGVPIQSGSASANTAQEAFDLLQQQRLNSVTSRYSGTEVVNVDVGYRGLPVTLSYPIENGSRLDLAISDLGINQTFLGPTREDTRSQLREFFKHGDILGRVAKELAKSSPVDPVAGNPNSLESRMVALDFERSFRAFATNIRASSDDEQAWNSQESAILLAANTQGPTTSDGPLRDRVKTPSTTLGLELASYRQSGLNSTSLTLPLTYAFAPEPRRPFSLSPYLQYTDTEGAKTYNLGIGASYRFRLTRRWHLTPSANIAVTGSPDLGSVGEIASGSLTSDYLLFRSGGGYALWMGNAVNYLRTLKVSGKGYSIDPQIDNTVFVNALVLATPLRGLGDNYSLEYSFTDTRFTGTSLFDRRYDEIGVALGTSRGAAGARRYLRAGLSYLNGSHSRGGALKVYYTF
jgi:hypothetical protein